MEPLAPWRSPLARAIHRNRALPSARYLQLATLRVDGTPANRSVVFRGFLTGTNRLMFISDRRSEKINQIIHNPATEACWYFTKTREQFRLAGRLWLISADTAPATLQSARVTLWQNISDSARRQFAWPQPKAPRSPNDAFATHTLDLQAPPLCFCLLLLTVHSVDHLDLRAEPQNRHLYQKLENQPPENSQWQTTIVNP
ncbi:MAG: pyridoxamine 5'-phosphate oxidase [Phormidesmis sp. RL_2_1]|nr:pyridoxamine 5'-phosphate oxidase [Phormidesmis sp. RL_2_1]